MKGEKDSNRFLDLGNSLRIQALLSFSLNHAFQHSVHIADRWSKNIDCSGVHELSSFLRCGEVAKLVGNAFVDLRAGPDVAYFSLSDDFGIDRFDGINGFLSPLNILIERERRKINNDRIEPRPRRFHGLRQ